MVYVVTAMLLLYKDWSIDSTLSIDLERLERFIKQGSYQVPKAKAKAKPEAEAEAEVEPFECCVCLEENTREIKKCKNIHTDKICRSCVVKMDRCPICRERFPSRVTTDIIVSFYLKKMKYYML